MSRRLPFLLPGALLLALAFAPSSASAATHWLCGPGVANDPCRPSLSTTQVTPTGTVLGANTPTRDAKPKYDCFYVYPTTSDEKQPQADFKVTPELRSIALYQAARYSQHCRVYAPVYRQITIAGLLAPGTVTPAMRAQSLKDVEDAFADYLKNDNKGRGFVLIGHSQGSFLLRQLIADMVDKRKTVRSRLISAVLMGGNVLVKKGKAVGGDFENVPACRSSTQLGCVIAFSTYNDTPPADSLFGRTGGAGITATGNASEEVLCTNPAALGGGSAKLDTLQPVAPFAPGTAIGIEVPLIGVPVPKVSTAWFEAKGAYTGRCSSAGGANVLRISGNDGAPVLHPLPDATWGLHLVDANIALGDLVKDVTTQAATFLQDGPGASGRR